MKTSEVNRVKVMQIATTSGDQPWICTVYFVIKNGNFYWLSFPERRHSQALADNQKAAVAIAIHHDVPVVGLQAEGDVRVVSDFDEMEGVLRLYVEKYGQGSDFSQRFKDGKNHHQLYCMSPRRVMVFDERTTTGVPYRQIQLTD